MPELIGPRALNRALLARQLLQRRHALAVPDALERVAGLQHQEPELAYYGLWSRLEGFERAAVNDALEARTVVRGTLMRATQHMVRAEDYLAWRPLLQRMLAARGSLSRAGLDLETFDAIVREALPLDGGTPTPRERQVRRRPAERASRAATARGGPGSSPSGR